MRLPDGRDGRASQYWPGVATFGGALFLLVLALLRGNEEGWSSRLIVSLFAGAAALLVAFHRGRASRPPADAAAGINDTFP